MADETGKKGLDLARMRQFAAEHKDKLVIGTALVLVALLVGGSYAFITAVTNRHTGSAAVDQVPTDIAGDQNQVTALPATQRTLDDQPKQTGADSKNAVVDPFAGAWLRGVVLDESGDSLAIIEIGGKAYVASKGAVIANGWTVQEIKASEVTLKAGERELCLELNGRINSTGSSR